MPFLLKLKGLRTLVSGFSPTIKTSKAPKCLLPCQDICTPPELESQAQLKIGRLSQLKPSLLFPHAVEGIEDKRCRP